MLFSALTLDTMFPLCFLKRPGILAEENRTIFSHHRVREHVQNNGFHRMSVYLGNISGNIIQIQNPVVFHAVFKQKWKKRKGQNHYITVTQACTQMVELSKYSIAARTYTRPVNRVYRTHSSAHQHQHDSMILIPA